jgi:hypothetical protein
MIAEPRSAPVREQGLSAAEHRQRSARFRALAADATTPRAKAYLLEMARQSDILAEGARGPDAETDRAGPF